MGFTQKDKSDLDVCEFCQGCEEHCKLGAHYKVDVYRDEVFLHVFPTISGRVIKKYFIRDKDGGFKLITAKVRVVKEKENVQIIAKLMCKEMIDTSRQIATLCDKYKTR